MSSGTMRLASGEAVTTASGAVPEGATRVTFRLPDEVVVEASVVGTTWAAWYPGDAPVDVDTLVAYDAAGQVLPPAGER